MTKEIAGTVRQFLSITSPPRNVRIVHLDTLQPDNTINKKLPRLHHCRLRQSFAMPTSGSPEMYNQMQRHILANEWNQPHLLKNALKLSAVCNCYSKWEDDCAICFSLSQNLCYWSSSGYLIISQFQEINFKVTRRKKNKFLNCHCNPM